MLGCAQTLHPKYCIERFEGRATRAPKRSDCVHNFCETCYVSPPLPHQMETSGSEEELKSTKTTMVWRCIERPEVPYNRHTTFPT